MAGKSRSERRRHAVAILDAPWNGETRQADGMIVQVVGPGGERRWFHRHHEPLRLALAAICGLLDSWPGEWRVETISTPASIYRDLQGSRAELAPRDLRRNGYGEPMVPEGFSTPEAQMLGQIGRLDLLASRQEIDALSRCQGNAARG